MVSMSRMPGDPGRCRCSGKVIPMPRCERKAWSSFGDMVRRKQVYKITYPNGKIYVGMDLTGAISYFGSPSAKERIAADLAEHRLDLTVRKEILWESETATDAEVREKERHFIRETGANNPAVGYNLTPRWSESQ